MSRLQGLGLIVVVLVCLGVAALTRAVSGPATSISSSGARDGHAAMLEPSAAKRAPGDVESDTAHQEILDPNGPEAQLATQLAERNRMARDRALYQELKNKTERTALESHMLHNLEDTNRYPPENQRFPSRAHDPLARRNEPVRNSEKSQDGRYMLSVWTSSNQVDVGGKLTVFVELIESRGNAPSGASDVSLALVSDGLAPILLPLRSQGKGQYMATLDASNINGRPLPAGYYKLVAKGPQGLVSINQFGVRPAYGRLTGAYRDSLESGALIVEAEVDAFEEGRFLVVGSLYTDDDIPIGVAQVMVPLSAGTHWVRLSFSGLMVRDGGRNGPYRLAHISVEKQAFPLASGVKATPNYLTRAYPLKDFSSEPYNRLDGPSEDDEDGVP